MSLVRNASTSRTKNFGVLSYSLRIHLLFTSFLVFTCVQSKTAGKNYKLKTGSQVVCNGWTLFGCTRAFQKVQQRTLPVTLQSATQRRAVESPNNYAVRDTITVFQNHLQQETPSTNMNSTAATFPNTTASSQRLRLSLLSNDLQKTFSMTIPTKAIEQNTDTVASKPRFASPKPLVEGGAISNTLSRLWPETFPGSGQYEVVYNLSQVHSEGIRSKLHWGWRYLSRGTNLIFREAVPGDVPVLQVVEGDGCYSPLGPPSRLSLAVKCSSVHTVIHEILHFLGMIHEHQREDRDAFLNVNMTNVSKVWRKNLLYESTGLRTPYDLASIMHYPRYITKTQAILTESNPLYKNFLDGRRSFLSSCDWAFLNQLYPGKRQSFRCVPHKAPNVLVPLWGSGITSTQCLYANAVFFDIGLCVYKKNNMRYPTMLTIEDELGFHPENPPQPATSR